MVLPDVPLLNWNQQMGILLVFPLVGHFVVQLLGGGQVGSMMWTLVATKLLTIQSMQTPTFSKKPNMHREKVPCREALELGGSPNYMIYSQILRNCLLAKQCAKY